jgi:uncharacterized membrane protein
VIGALLVGALACYALLRQRTPKQDPTCGGRIVPNGTPEHRDALREGWRQYRKERDRIVQESRNALYAAQTAQFHRDQAKAKARIDHILMDIGEYRGQ